MFHTNIDTSQDAINAATIFGKLGYKSYYNVKPTVSYMKENAPNGTRRLGCEIVFLSGYGNSQLMSFNYKRKGGNYSTGIIQGKNWKSKDTGYTYAGVKDCNMSKTKLFVLAGCQTAKGSDNITRDIVKNGADTAVEWKKSVDASDHTKWLKRFCGKLAGGYDINSALNYANSFSYSDNNVKTAVICGNGTTKIYPCISSNILKAQKKDLRKIRINSKIKIGKKTKYKILKKRILKGFKEANVKININNYVIKREGNVVDLIYTVNGCETTSGYTMIVEKGTVTEIYNNMSPNYNIVKQKVKSIKKPKLTRKFRKACFKNAKGRLELCSKIVSQEGKLIYDIKDNTYKFYVLTDYQENKDGGFGRYGTYYRIK